MGADAGATGAAVAEPPVCVGREAGPAASLMRCAGIPCHVHQEKIIKRVDINYRHQVFNGTIGVIETSPQGANHLFAFEAHLNHVIDC